MRLSKKVLYGIIASCCVMFGSTTSSYANNSLFNYVSAKIGYNHQFLDKIKINSPGEALVIFTGQDDSSMSVGVAAGIGYKFTPKVGMRGELEYAYRTATRLYVDPPQGVVGTVDLKSQTHTVFGNIYLDYYVMPKMNIYAGAGLGMSIVTQMDVRENNNRITRLGSSSTFAWQVGGGVGYAITRNIGLDLNVRYVDYGVQKYFAGIDTMKVSSSGVEALVGLAYKF